MLNNLRSRRRVGPADMNELVVVYSTGATVMPGPFEFAKAHSVTQPLKDGAAR